jgi:hypothetical protein
MNADSQIVIYRAKDGRTCLEVNLQRETVWLSQAQLATLFDVERSVITKHIRNVFQTNELESESNVQKMHIAGSDKPVAFYALDMIIAVGYRVNSKRGTQFRIWATQVLRDHLLKGYACSWPGSCLAAPCGPERTEPLKSRRATNPSWWTAGRPRA